MLADNVLEIIYRSLRDSVSKNIANVGFDKDKGVIHLTLKGPPLPYPCIEKTKDEKNDQSFSKTVWKINTDGISSDSVDESSKIIAEEKKSWFKKLFKI